MQRNMRNASGSALALGAGMLLLPAAAAAQAVCEAETASLQALAQGIRVDIAAPADLRSGGVVHIAWRAASRFPGKLPAFVVVSVPGEARVVAPPLAKPAPGPKPDQAGLEQAGNPAPELPGVFALPPGARGPLDLAFGAGMTRLLVPLHQPGSKLAGAVDVRLFEAGTIALSTAIVAKTACGERALADVRERQVTVAPGTPEIVVQDPFDIDVPKRIVISNSGRYRLHVFDGRYRVFELATGAKIIDRAGHNPNFSPTSRFLVADVGDPDGFDLEVIDLVSQEVIYKARGPFLGWTSGDAFYIDGAAEYGGLSVRPSLISRPLPSGSDPGDNPGDGLSIEAPGSCHACASWTDSPMTLDLDNGIAVFPDDFNFGDASLGTVYELASGHRACCTGGGPAAAGKPKGEVDARVKQFVAATYEVRPVEWKPGWSVRDGLAFSHAYDPPTVPGRPADDGDRIAGELRRLLAQHRALDQRASSTRIAGLSEGVVLRGDWRQQARRPRTTEEASSRQGLVEELGRFGVDTAPPFAREIIPFANSSGSTDGRARDETGDKKLEAAIIKRTRALEQRLVAEVPALKPLLGQRKPNQLTAFPYAGDLSQARIVLTEHMEGAWRWEVEGNPVWLLQLITFEGSAAMGQSAIFLLEGKGKTAGRVTNLSEMLEGLWDGQYRGTAQVNRLKPQLYFGRYLVVGSAGGRAIGVVDIKSGRKLALLRDVPQADLLEDVLLTADARHVVQLNSDGQFFLHEIAGGRVTLSGRYVDGEIIVYTPEAYYWSSYEGAHFVQLRFPGLPGLFTFQQFAAVLERPDVIKATLTGAPAAAPARLVPPPMVEARLLEGSAGAGRRLRVQARSGEELARLRLYEDGQLIAERSLSGHQYQDEIVLPPASNARWVTALAVDKGGLVSAPQTLPLAPGTAAPGRLHGVLVGVDTYPEAQLRLSYAKSDAMRLAQALKASTGRYYASEALQVLLDSEATPHAIAAALERVAAAAEAKDTIVFSFAGHGVKGEDGRYYLTPAGYRSDDTRGTGLSWTRVSGILGRAKARVVVILDACHSGLSGAEGLGTNDDAVASLLSGAHAPMLVLAASKGRQYSYEDPKWGGGVFTHALVEALQRNWQSADVNGNGVIEVSELYRALRSIVARETQSNQTPWLARQDLIGDFAIF